MRQPASLLGSELTIPPSANTLNSANVYLLLTQYGFCVRKSTFARNLPRVCVLRVCVSPQTRDNARAGNALAYETRVGSPPDFQLKRVSALKELEIPLISSSVKASAQAGCCVHKTLAVLLVVRDRNCLSSNIKAER